MKAAAETFRSNPELDVASAITELAVGEALVSFLDGNGTPGVVERALVVPPRSKLGPIAREQRLRIVNWSPMQGKYEAVVDRESAYEVLKARAERAAREEAAAEAAQREEKELAREAKRTARRKPAEEVVPEPVVEAAPKPVLVAAEPVEGQRKGGFMRGILGALLGRPS